MLRKIEKVAANSRLRFSSSGDVWSCDDDSPHIATFRYELGVYKGDSEELTTVGTVDGYRITQD